MYQDAGWRVFVKVLFIYVLFVPHDAIYTDLAFGGHIKARNSEVEWNKQH